MQRFLLEVREPKKLLLKTEVEWASFDLSEGRVTIYPGHAPVMGVLMNCELTYCSQGQQHALIINKGFAQITPNHTTLLIG